MKNKIKKLEKISRIQKKFNHTYLHGVYLAINAIPDAYLLVDGPTCIFDKIDFIYRTHDLYSDLIRRDAFHRVCSTGVQADQSIVVDDRSATISQLLGRMDKQKDCAAIFISSMPMATITGTQYDSIINRLSAKMRVPMMEIASKSLHGDWLSGYEETLMAIAGKLKLRSGAGEPGKVAIVGYFFDRNEGDHTGNIKEFERMLKGLSLDLVSVWLSGCSFGSLKDIEKAGLIISLPYARNAARQIASKTKADLLELDLPVGLENTKQWLKAVAKKTGRGGKVEAFISQELRVVIPAATLVCAESLMGKKIVLCADPYLTSALALALKELGGQVVQSIVFSKREPAQGYILSRSLPGNVYYEADYSQVFKIGKSNADLVIGNSHISYLLRLQNIRKPYVEIGYPSFYYHCLVSSPFMGFKGYVHLLNRINNSLLQNA